MSLSLYSAKHVVDLILKNNRGGALLALLGYNGLNMNLEALEYIVNNRADLIEDNVIGTRYDPLATVGVAKLLLAKKGDLNVLSAAQRYHYEKFIRPLIEQVSCEGVVGDGTCTGNGFVDEESLIAGYIEGELLCQHCRFDSEGMSTK